MRRFLAIAVLAAACGGAPAAERVSVLGVDRLSGELSAQEVELPQANLSAVSGPAGAFLLAATLDGTQVQGGAPPDCALRRKVDGALVARSLRCVSLLGQYAALERARQFLLSAGAEALPPAPVLVDDAGPPGLRYVAAADAFLVREGPQGARVPAALNPGIAARELSRRQLRGVADAHPEEAEGVAMFLGAAAAADPGYLESSEPQGDPTGSLDLSRPLPAGAPRSAVLAGALWAWADASGDLIGASRAALAAARALGAPAADPAAVLSLVAGQLEGAERDEACAIFRARLHAGSVAACP